MITVERQENPDKTKIEKKGLKIEKRTRLVKTSFEDCTGWFAMAIANDFGMMYFNVFSA